MAIINYPADNATLILDGQAFTDFEEGDSVTIEYENPVAESTNSANGGVSINERLDRNVVNVTVRLQRNSGNDVTMNSWRNQSPVKIMDGSLKLDFFRDGDAVTENWQLSTGRITDQPGVTSNNQDGENVNEWTLQFRNGVRTV